MKADGGLADFTFIPRRESPLIGQGNTGGVKLAFPDIEVHRGNLHPGSQSFFEIVHERFFQPRDLPPDKSATGPHDENENHQYSQENASSGAIHILT